MKRAKRIAVVAHCLLNVNTKVCGLATYAAAHERAKALIDGDIGLIQLPCPEFTYLGAKRWGMTKEQYDTIGYRKHCRALAEGVVEQLVEHRAAGAQIVEIIGVDGSPSCGVFRTCAGFQGGEISRLEELGALPQARNEQGRGVFMEELVALLSQHGLSDIPLTAVSE